MRKKIAGQAAYHLTNWWYWEKQQEVCGLRCSIGGGWQEGSGGVGTSAERRIRFEGIDEMMKVYLKFFS